MELRPVEASDVARLEEIALQPSVAREWLHGPELDDEGATHIAIVDDHEVVGMVQYWEENEPDYRHAGMDIFVAEEAQGRGIGPRALRALARVLFAERGHHRITIDPSLANVRAIAAYEKVGFKAVGVMRRYCRGVDGTWEDGLFMDLLPEELTAD